MEVALALGQQGLLARGRPGGWLEEAASGAGGSAEIWEIEEWVDHCRGRCMG
jgi:hypothetical protein